MELALWVVKQTTLLGLLQIPKPNVPNCIILGWISQNSGNKRLIKMKGWLHTFILPKCAALGGFCIWHTLDMTRRERATIRVGYFNNMLRWLHHQQILLACGAATPPLFSNLIMDIKRPSQWLHLVRSWGRAVKKTTPPRSQFSPYILHQPHPKPPNSCTQMKIKTQSTPLTGPPWERPPNPPPSVNCHPMPLVLLDASGSNAAIRQQRRVTV